jgi:hypothetical protein
MENAERLVREFFRRVWAPPHDLDAVDELMTEVLRGRARAVGCDGRIIQVPIGGVQASGKASARR